MPATRFLGRHRQLLQRSLFLLAIVAPSVLLVMLSLRLIAQDTELAGKRAQDSRRLAAAETARRLTARLEQLKLQALGGGSTWNRGAEAIALVARLDGENLLLPWDDTSGARRFREEISAAPFAAAIADAEHDEFVTHDRTAAHAKYGVALTGAQSPEQQAAAAVPFLRTSSSDRDIVRVASSLLQSSVVDEEGVPVPLRAIHALLKNGAMDSKTAQVVIDALHTTLNRTPPPNLTSLHTVRDLAESTHLNQPDVAGLVSALRVDVRSRLAAARQAYGLQQSLTGVLERAEDPDSAWIPFGSDQERWLVTVTRPPATPDAMVVAVRATATGQDLSWSQSAARSSEFEPLGAAYPDVFVRLSPQPAKGSDSLRAVLIGVVLVTLAIALSGGWLFWRDVQRDLRLAELRSQFVASVSHELKTPLTAIRMFAETLRQGRTPPERTVEYVDTIVSESERLTRLLNNVLDFSSVEQGTRRYRLTLQPLAPIVRSAARTLRYPLEQAAFDLQVFVDDENVQARCDADALAQAILNLLSNAMKYSGDSRVIELRLATIDGIATIAVRDQGVGIPPTEQPRIFEKFFRGAGEAHQRVAGTGLGLTLVQHAVRAHGGSVVVDSSPGKGSTFTILLPGIDTNVFSPIVDGPDVAQNASPSMVKS